MKKFAGAMLLSLLFLGSGPGCPGGEGPNVMIFPFIVVVDNTHGRAFVLDDSGNRLNLIDTDNDQIFAEDDEDPLLSDEDQVLYQQFPSNGALASLDGGISRIFVIGGDSAPSQTIFVLDYAGGEVINRSPISPIVVAGAGSLDVLVGIAVDPLRDRLYVTNSSSGMLHFYNTTTGIEEPGSPIVIGGTPTRVALDLDSGLMAIADGASTMVSFVSLSTPGPPLAMLDVGVTARSLGMATNANGSVLFLSGEATNIAKAFLLNLADLSTSNEIFQLTPPSPTDPLPDPLFITGSLNLVSAGNLTDGRMAAFFTQSTGDLFLLDLTSDLNTISPNVTIIGAASGEGIANILNGSGQVTKVYFASPSSGVVTVLNPLDNTVLDQIN